MAAQSNVIQSSEVMRYLLLAGDAELLANNSLLAWVGAEGALVVMMQKSCPETSTIARPI
jgi:hypothetical protein